MSRATVFAVFVCVFHSIGIVAEEATHIPMDVAVERGLVEADVVGRGACSGDAICLRVRRKVSRTVTITVEPGTVVKSESGDVQSMVCHGVKYQKVGTQYRRVDKIVLEDDSTQTYLLEAFCRDFSKPTPGTDNAFRFGTTDLQATRVIVKGKNAQVSIRTIQAAVWLQDGVSEADIRQRFRATDVELRAAGLLVESASAARQGDEATETRTEEEIRVLVSGAYEAVMERLAQRPFRHGDRVEVVAESTAVRTLRRTIGSARQGDTFEVIVAFPQRVSVDFQLEDGGDRVRGLIAIADLRLVDDAPRGAGRPLLRELGELVSETELEVVTMSERGL